MTRPTAIVGAVITSILLAPALTAAPYAETSGWPTDQGWNEYAGSWARTGRSPTIGPDKAEQATDAAILSGRSFSSPVIDPNGNVYVGTTAGKVHKLTAALQNVWTSPGLGGEIRSSVLVGGDGTVYAAPVDDDLVALNGSDGTVKWRYDVGNTAPAGEYVVTAAPALHPDGFILQPSMDGGLYAVTLDGKTKWTFRTPAGSDNKLVATPAVAGDGTIYVGNQNGVLFAIDNAGKEKWQAKTNRLTDPTICPSEQQVAAPSIGDDGSIYVGTRVARCNAGAVYAFQDQGTSAKLKWWSQVDEKVTAPVTIGADGALYVGAIDGTFYRLDAADGKTRWTFNPQSDDPGLNDAIGVPLALSVAELSVVDAGGRVYVPYWNVDLTQGFPPQHSLRSPLYALKTSDGSIAWRDIIPKAPRGPALMPTEGAVGTTPQGLLYVAADNGRVYAFGTVEPIAAAIPGAPQPIESPTAVLTSPAGPGGTDGPDTEAPRQRESPAPGVIAWALLAAALALIVRRRRA